MAGAYNVALWVLDYMYRYTNTKGVFAHVWDEMGLLREHVKGITWSRKLLRAHVKLLRAHIKKFHVPLGAPYILFPYTSMLTKQEHISIKFNNQ